VGHNIKMKWYPTENPQQWIINQVQTYEKSVPKSVFSI